ncbi:hypothetical protein BX600DRAFT_535029 [Xylariales sp. PMI_506]|nr:hypothetical protein BX600DRAFT_535029 [Xylariales sp. PMI_506]
MKNIKVFFFGMLDKALPGCQRCLKAGYICEGYNLPLRMQNHVVMLGPQGNQQLVRVPGGVSTLQGPPSEMSMDAFQEQMAFTYFFSTYRWGHLWRPLMQTTKKADFTGAAYTPSVALAYGYMGLSQGEEHLRAKSMVLYGQAIREVQSYVDGMSQENLPRLITAVLVLTMYEYVIENKGTSTHYAGLLQIIQHYGPETFQKEPLLGILRITRALLICRALVEPEPTFLEDEEWKSIPWAYSNKTPEDLLFDILVHLPGLTHDVAMSHSLPQPNCTRLLRSRVKDLWYRLAAWRRDWSIAYQQSGAEAIEAPAQIDTSAVEDPWLRDILSTQIEFATLTQALGIMNYNAGLLQLAQLDSMLLFGSSDYENAEGEAPRLNPVADLAAIHDAQRDRSKGGESPLLGPRDLEYLLQPALESLRVLFFLSTGLSTHKEKLPVNLQPVGILYCALRSMPEFNTLAPVVDAIPFFRDAERELGRFDVARHMELYI